MGVFEMDEKSCLLSLFMSAVCFSLEFREDTLLTIDQQVDLVPDCLSDLNGFGE